MPVTTGLYVEAGMRAIGVSNEMSEESAVLLLLLLLCERCEEREDNVAERTG